MKKSTFILILICISIALMLISNHLPNPHIWHGISILLIIIPYVYTLLQGSNIFKNKETTAKTKFKSFRVTMVIKTPEHHTTLSISENIEHWTDSREFILVVATFDEIKNE